MPFGVVFLRTSNTGICETFGKFQKTVSPGLNLYVPFVQRIVPISNRLRQDIFKFEVKTKDNAFTVLKIAVQYKIKPEDTQKAFYSLDDPIEQINSYIGNVIRAKVPEMELDQVFASQDDISKNVSEKLAMMMKDHGYTIENTLIKEIEPNAEIKNALNKINATKRLREAAKNEADAEYIKKIREAEADRDRKRLQGEGISLQRQAIMEGYKTGVETMTKGLGLSAQNIIDFVMKTQHLDTMETIGKSSNAKTIFLQHDPSSLKIAKDLMSANEAK